MTNDRKINDRLQVVTKLLSRCVGVVETEIDYEVQDGGGFVLFRVRRITPAISDEKVRGSIYAQIMGQLGGSDAKWMVVFLEKDDVVDVIDSMAGY